MLLSIPVTTFPLIAALSGGSVISPLAGIPLGLLVIISLLIKPQDGSLFPVSAKLLLLFVGFAIFSSVMAYFQKIFPFLGQTVPIRELRAVLTLAIGVAFYLISAKFPNSETKLRSSLRWLYFGGAIILIWSTIQAFFIFQNYGHPIAMDTLPFPNVINRIHRLFSTRDLLTTRVTGLAYEPSFLADQLVILYLPLWFASVVRGYSVFNTRSSIWSVELGLAVWGLVIVFLSQSRIGLISAFSSLVVLSLVAAWKLATRLTKRVIHALGMGRNEVSGLMKSWIRITIWLLFLTLVISAFFGVVRFAGRLDNRIARIFKLDFLEILRSHEDPVYTIASILAYAERVVYWDGGFRVFSLYPIFGVGLGNEGFYFRETVPAYGTRLTEIVRILEGSPQFPNPKNLWVRLLAETGIIGFMLFVAWLLLLAIGAWAIYKFCRGIRALLGLAGLLGLLAQVFEGFSLDTFALPQLWILCGLLTAALMLHSNGSIDSEGSID